MSYSTQQCRAASRSSRALEFAQEKPAGIADVRALPDPEFGEHWDAIIMSPVEKQRLLAQAILNFRMRGVVPSAVLPLHGVILLVGPPGTGKTSLAKGVASRVAETLPDEQFRFIEVDPHALSSSSLGKSQRAVTELFGTTIREHAAHGPLIVLLDEVETLVVDRGQLSLEANPIDVHRATDAALVQLDQFAAELHDVLFVATSNFPRAIDAAFVSRADLVLTVPVPTAEARRTILRDTLTRLANEYPAMAALAQSQKLAGVAIAAEGLDGRSLRKLVATACTFELDTCLDPNQLTIEHLKLAAETASAEAKMIATAREEA